jgi:hypothetical protein
MLPASSAGKYGGDTFHPARGSETFQGLLHWSKVTPAADVGEVCSAGLSHRLAQDVCNFLQQPGAWHVAQYADCCS